MIEFQLMQEAFVALMAPVIGFQLGLFLAGGFALAVVFITIGDPRPAEVIIVSRDDA